MKRFLVLLPELAPFILWADEIAPGLPEPLHIEAGVAYFLGLAPRRIITCPYLEKSPCLHLTTGP